MQCRPLVHSIKFSLHIESLRIKQLVLDFYSLCKITMSPVLQEEKTDAYFMLQQIFQIRLGKCLISYHGRFPVIFM